MNLIPLLKMKIRGICFYFSHVTLFLCIYLQDHMLVENFNSPSPHWLPSRSPQPFSPAVLSSRSLQPFHSASMSVTPTQFRTLIDELDAILRRASGEGNLKTVFAAEKGRIVSPFIFFTLLLTHFILEHTHENSEGDQGPAWIRWRN